MLPTGFKTASGTSCYADSKLLANIEEKLNNNLATDKLSSTQNPSHESSKSQKSEDKLVIMGLKEVEKEEEEEEEEEELQLSPIAFIFPKDLPHLQNKISNKINNNENEEIKKISQRSENMSVEMSSCTDDFVFDDDDIFPTPFSAISRESKENIELLNVQIARLYPFTYMIKLESGRQEVESEMSFLSNEVSRGKERERRQEELVELIGDEIELVMNSYRPEEGGVNLKISTAELETLDIYQLYYHLKSQGEEDVATILSLLSDEKKEELKCFRDSEIRKIQTEVFEKYADKKKELTTGPIPFLKIRLIDNSIGQNYSKSAILSLWRPDESLCKELREGECYTIKNVSIAPNPFNLKFNSTRTTQITVHKEQRRDFKLKRVLTTISFINSPQFKPEFDEFDTVGIVVYVSQNDSTSTIVHIGDENYKFLSLKFWKPLKELGLENILLVGQIVWAKNLHWRSVSKQETPYMAFYQDVTLFSTKEPSELIFKKYFEELTNFLKKVPKYIDNYNQLIRKSIELQTNN